MELYNFEQSTGDRLICSISTFKKSNKCYPHFSIEIVQGKKTIHVIFELLMTRVYLGCTSQQYPRLETNSLGTFYLEGHILKDMSTLRTPRTTFLFIYSKILNDVWTLTLELIYSSLETITSFWSVQWVVFDPLKVSI